MPKYCPSQGEEHAVARSVLIIYIKSISTRASNRGGRRYKGKPVKKEEPDDGAVLTEMPGANGLRQT